MTSDVGPGGAAARGAMDRPDEDLGGPGHRRKPTVVVVDDDADIREVLDVALTRCGAAVATYGNACDALAGLQALTVDALVTDLALAPCDGLWLVEQVRALPGLARLPIIVVTGHSDPGRLDAAWHAGADEILLKPVHAQDIYERIVRRLA